ncbi:diaminopimelate dehydrogenase [Desulfitobacterium dichloroeliminans LMG P-21439]|uniref:Meso-diaminopimelate D-dehydrogenase n=1 Tax=Desulfitobacterium dichloroeliminans (strain LMG P-21439 / DCA1) TaxID=871963 RepID=L0F3F9_DESDL|nr:diaminopimelate dehydrogenase [Desulfitobacterium dichloroeliminans]AGA67712.1 diaminopimelate dehydrogenase [Desulfitobacterium dichloroeliminans LMG P-21439]
MNKIRIGIVGYGNLGKSVELGIRQNEDMELVGIFTRRNPSTIETVTRAVAVYTMDEAKKMTEQIDVMVLCGGSMSDLPFQGPEFASLFNTVDGYDNHAQIPDYFSAMNENALEAQKICIIAGGWDPGMFSINRLYAEAILPEGNTYTFWGKGVSQGHSDAIRRIKGVMKGKQYTIPIENAIEAVRRGDRPELSTREKHHRVCFVVAEEGTDKEQIEHEIKTMPNYFADYDTEIHFITEEELEKNHPGLPHGGLIIRHGRTGLHEEHNHVIEYQLALDSNPDFTANVLVAFARAAHRLNQEGVAGAKTVVDIAPAYLSSKSAEELRKSII